MSAAGPERPHIHPTTLPATNFAAADSSPPLAAGQLTRQKQFSQRPHRSMSFAGHTGQLKRQLNVHPSVSYGCQNIVHVCCFFFFSLAHIIIY